jgi:hypothetical protein
MNNDGTQDPGPPPVLRDPLAGLVTGARYEPEPLKVRVVEPPMPDIAAVREAMASVLDEDSEFNLDSIMPMTAQPADQREPTTQIPAQAPSPAAEPIGRPVLQVPVSEVPVTQPPAPVAASVKEPTPTPPAGIPAQRGIPRQITAANRPRVRRVWRMRPLAAAGEKVRRIRVSKGFARRYRMQKPPPGVAKGASSAGGVTLIVALLVVMGVIAIVLLASLIETIAAVFS